MEKSDGCCSTHLIDGDGAFNDTGLEQLIKEVRLGECGLSYAIVSIMGPQSSGKSTLLNHLFGTSFREMDAFKGRSQTTKGIWMARCAGIEPCTLVMDLEGTDGRERGEDDTAFEKQSALFALAVSDIVLINMWCHDIGREQAANKPLLKTVFQVMMRLFSPRKTTLMFVIRDKTRTPLENLEPVLREDIQKIWDSVPKPEAHKETRLSEFFNVEVVALSSYEEKEEQFKEQVASLRQRFFHSIAPGGLAGDRRGVVPASGFSFSAQEIWKVIKENKDLDLPAHKVMVATVRCEEIANEKYGSFVANEKWCQMEEAVESGPVSGFGKKLSAILNISLSEYDAEAIYFDEGVRSAKQKQLEEKLLQLVQPAHQSMLGHIRSGTLEKFKEAFDKALNAGEGFSLAAQTCTQSYMAQFDEWCADAVIEQANWDTSKVRDKLRRDIDAHVASVHAAKLSELTSSFEVQFFYDYPFLLLSIIPFDPLASNSWEKIPSTRTLITPVQCKSLWRQFKTETEYTVTQAISAQEAHKRNNNWLPPPWAIVALLVLGFNEFMTLLRNPLYLGVIFVGFLLVKALWVQLDISGEFRNGALPGLLSLSSKFVPTIMNLLKRLAEEGQKPATADPQRNATKSFQNGSSSFSDSSSSASSGVTSPKQETEYSNTLKDD
uniref:GB1/RHD3-type G domain-containing protein n=1 Tax=Populus alba TaxID=43335 RepID=A0A4U5QZU0_POPAL|nr:hypothetical protein D5086_0000023990 [Populus alba]